MHTNQKNFASILLQIGALKINLEKEYTWASGWKSPIYCNNRKIIFPVEFRRVVRNMLEDLVYKATGGDTTIVLAAVATGAIALGAIVADRLGMPFVYVRPKPKDHGLGTQIEGEELNESHRVLVFEDLVSTGKSSLEAVDVLRATGAEVIGMVALFTYDFDVAHDAFAAKNVPLHTLSNYTTLMEMLEEQHKITAEQKEELAKWRLNPSEWRKAA